MIRTTQIISIMKKVLFLFLLPLLTLGQVGINTTTPNSSSILDIEATDKGILIPRISIPNLSSASPITSPATSLLVYNTNTTTGTGFYFWNGTNWAPLGGADNDWIFSGNNIYNGNTGNVGIGTATPTTKLHVENSGPAVSILNENFEANSLGTLTTSGSQNWYVQNTQVGAGTYSAASGGITHNQQTNLTATVTLTSPAVLTFKYRVSSEGNFDYLRFFVNGTQITQWSGNVSWATYTYNLPAGNHTLNWRYLKDGSQNSGEDKAYLDDILITGTTSSSVIRIVDGAQAAGKVLTSDANGNASWQSLTNSSIPNLPQIIAVSGFTIPSCFNYSVNSTGTFTKSILGTNTTITWKILQKQTATNTVTATTPTGTAQVASGPVLAERLQVEYTFNPPLPFSPNAIMFTVNNTSSLPDVFTLNYASKSTNSIVVNIARSDSYGNFTTASCWASQFYFDLFITN
ncbi:hypothetical protein SAMN05444005_1108 [Flavobacterium urocaniciphilum]|uniref:Uncharacterized protein n=2 Tax=Flavobacterium urocaniciphilum TaxID=1299341 RepID=A0A1H9E5Y0_9FLAO|nr:hypothetical protein SAMN05444005_1108 [Flavobacterium urocaniciphilum]